MRSSPSHSIFLLALWCVLALPVGAQTATPATDASFRLQAGDAVRITVWRQPELSGEFLVTSNGQIAHPLYREIQVTGRPLATLESQIGTFLRQYVENPQFVVEPLLRISVSGLVDRPNVYSVTPGTTITQAIALAGGITEQGRQDRVRLVRNQSGRFVDPTEPRQGSMPVLSGDEILVGPRTQWFRNVFVPAATIVGAIASLVLAIRRD